MSDIRERIHQLVNEVAMSEEQIILQCLQVIEKAVFFKEYVKKSTAGDLVRRID